MLGQNFLPNHVVYNLQETEASATDGSVRDAGNTVDLLAASAARRVTFLLHLGTQTSGAVVDLHFRTRAGASGNWTTVGSVTNAATKANGILAIEADSNSVELQRYVSLAYQRKGAASQVVAATAVLSDLRQPGTIVAGDVTAGAVVRQVTT